MKKESSSPRSQEPATCPYPQPHQFRPHPSFFLKIDFIIILLSRPRFSNWSLFFRFSRQNTIWPLLSPKRATNPAHLTVFNRITQLLFGQEQDHEAPQYAVFTIPLLHRHSKAQI